MKTKLLVISDSHGNSFKIEQALERERPVDWIVHCGDGAGDLAHVPVHRGVNIIRVLGNVDTWRGYDYERSVVQQIEGVTVMVVHGDLFRVQDGFGVLEREAEKHGAGLVLFGHTHVKLLRNGNPVLFNPGTVSKGTYGVILIEDGQMEFHHRQV